MRRTDRAPRRPTLSRRVREFRRRSEVFLGDQRLISGANKARSKDVGQQFKARRKKGACEGKEKREERYNREARSRNPDSKVGEECQDEDLGRIPGCVRFC